MKFGNNDQFRETRKKRFPECGHEINRDALVFISNQVANS